MVFGGFMFTYLQLWYNLYPSFAVFFGHKITHVAAGALVAGLGSYFHYPVTGLIICLVLAIGKEVADELQSPVFLMAHVFDVIVTCLGGLLGFYIGGLL